ncbi:MAG: hypothetical protein AAF628_30470 [Planctomycetota bacterium]
MQPSRPWGTLAGRACGLWLSAAPLLLALPVPAQFNDVERRNPGVTWWEPIGHPSGNPYPDLRQNPPSHQLPTGVPRGTLSYVWLPRETNDVDEDEVIDGFRAPLGPSPATTVYPATIYFPEIAIHRTRTVLGRVEPDPTQPPHFKLAESTVVFTGFGAWETSTNLLTPYTLPKTQQDVVLSLRWNADDSRDQPGTLMMWGDAHGAAYPLPVFGFVSPQGQVTPQLMLGSQPGYLNLTYRRQRPTVDARSSWGRSGVSPTVTFGYNVSTYRAPLVGGGGCLGWDLAAGPSHAGGIAIPLLNVGPFFGSSFPFLGQTFELNLLDPALAALNNTGFAPILDATGRAQGPLFPIPKLGSSALGLRLGVEFAVFDAGLSALVDTTQAAWIEIVP